MRTRAGIACLLMLTFLAATACQRTDTVRDTLRSAVLRTEALARTFTFTQSQGGHVTAVTGTIQDDLRYSLDATLDGSPLASEVVFDDSLALRAPNATYVNVLRSDASLGGGVSQQQLAGQAAQQIEAGQVAPPSGGVISNKTIAQQASQALPALSAGGWVVDPSGATTLTEASLPTDQPLADPLLQSLEILKYVAAAVDAAAQVVVYNPESLYYRPKLDTFPKPSSGEVRYDLIAPALTPRQRGAAVSGAFAQLPGLSFFRTMSVYVRGQYVVAVRERISPELRLEDPTSNLEARIGDYGINLPKNASFTAQGDYLLAAINRQRAFLHETPIVRREITVQFSDLGRPQYVGLPAGATQVTLTGLGLPGQVLFESSY